MQTLEKNTKIQIFLNLSAFVPSVPQMKMLLLSVFLSCHVSEGKSVFFHGISAKHHKKALLIYASNTLLQVSTLQSVSLHIIPLGAVWHRSEDSFWICLHLSVFLLSSITLSLPPSSSPNRCRLVLIDEANALQERLVLSPHAAKDVSCVLTLESRS